MVLHFNTLRLGPLADLGGVQAVRRRFASAPARAAAREGREGWLAELPALVARIAADWHIEVDDPFLPGGQTAWVASARDDTGHELVLKVCWPHPEAIHEADALRTWDGAGAVRLYRAEELAAATILLLERCRPGTQLRTAAPDEHDLVVASLLRCLWIDPPARPLLPAAIGDVRLLGRPL